jgi:hypothetical protein
MSTNDISTNYRVNMIPFHWGHVYMMDLRPFEEQYFEWFDDYNETLKHFASYGNCVGCLLAISLKAILYHSHAALCVISIRLQ